MKFRGRKLNLGDGVCLLSSLHPLQHRSEGRRKRLPPGMASGVGRSDPSVLRALTALACLAPAYVLRLKQIFAPFLTHSHLLLSPPSAFEVPSTFASFRPVIIFRSGYGLLRCAHCFPIFAIITVQRSSRAPDRKLRAAPPPTCGWHSPTPPLAHWDVPCAPARFSRPLPPRAAAAPTHDDDSALAVGMACLAYFA